MPSFSLRPDLALLRPTGSGSCPTARQQVRPCGERQGWLAGEAEVATSNHDLARRFVEECRRTQHQRQGTRPDQRADQAVQADPLQRNRQAGTFEGGFDWLVVPANFSGRSNGLPGQWSWRWPKPRDCATAVPLLNGPKVSAQAFDILPTSSLLAGPA